ncbi:MAG TPA: hypothetical protein VM285_12800 [Polyangia bacterium]|nr:hypothetical protein [Polyangia bacterium]
MKNAISICIGVALALSVGSALAQAAAKRAVAAVETPPPEASAAAPATEVENTLDRCRDGIDNDGDGHLDCADQDCWIYAMCITPSAPLAPVAPPPPLAHYMAVVPVAPGPERFHQCRDGIDNNNDGLTDCFEPSCQRGSHCRREMYFVPEPEGKAPGLLLSLGMGLALPNFRRPSATADSSRWGEDIPFDPDFGGLISFQLGYLTAPWFGIGANFMGGGTWASNRGAFDADDDSYKYNGTKGFAHAGGFVRFQYPAGRFVPYLNIAGGYTYAKFYWDVFDGREYWSDIDSQYAEEPDNLYYPSDSHTYTTGHFTMALEPGADFFVRKRSLAVGIKLWLPVFALPYSESSTDNVGVMFSLTYVPFWRERPALKPEYEQALAAQRQDEPAATLEPEPAPEPDASAIEPVEWEPEPVAPAPEPEPATAS